MINLFKRGTEISAKVEKKRDKQDERRQRAQARGQRPVK